MEAQKPKQVKEIIKSPEDIAIGARVRRIRDEILDLSQMKFAKETNMKQSSISAYELGERSIPVEFLITLHSKYGILPNYVTIGQLPISDTQEKKSATLTDMKELKSQNLALAAKVTELEKKVSRIIKQIKWD